MSDSMNGHLLCFTAIANDNTDHSDNFVAAFNTLSGDTYALYEGQCKRMSEVTQLMYMDQYGVPNIEQKLEEALAYLRTTKLSMPISNFSPSELSLQSSIFECAADMLKKHREAEDNYKKFIDAALDFRS